jgi:transcriptional regulator with XRE-family HTH domain
MAAILKTSQPEISRTENGELPPNKNEIARWARAYRLSVKKFVKFCQGAVEAKAQIEREKWELPLWRFSEAKTPAEIETFVCKSSEVRSA